MTDIGSILGGRYRLVELLGEGGMATIYRARDNQLERDVAVKVLRPEYGRDPDFVARFRLEAQAAASLNHPGIVGVHDFGTDPAGPFIVMELVDGEDLASIVRRSGALSPRQAARMTAQVARALAAAHTGGLIHRDVKPGNVMVDRTGRARVTDFGISRAVAEAALTLPGITLGSVHYFSPEQARGELATEASDIYSLGIVLYELLTGRRPWEGDSAAAIATARLTGAIPSVSTVRAGVPPILEAIDRKALAPDPADRFRSATEFAEALERFVADDGAAPVAGGPAAGVGAAATAASSAPSVAPPAAVDAARTVASAVARPSAAARVPYAPDAYVDADGDLDDGAASRPVSGGGSGRTRSARPIADDPDDAPPRGGGPWLWVSAALALVILGLAGFLIFRLLSGPTTPPTEQVSVPELAGKSYEEAQQAADDLGLVVIRFKFEASDQPDGTVLSQDPEAGTKVDPGTAIRLTLALGDETVSVPDLRGRIESEALNLISTAGLKIGIRTEAFDPFIPAGAVVSQDPGPGLVVTKGLEVNYVISKGLEPTPTPSPTPTPTPEPTPTPTPAPTPTPTPDPTPTPTPGPRNVGNYVCQTLDAATASLTADGFVLGTVTAVPAGTPDGTWIVVAQTPAPGTSRTFGSSVDLTVQDPASISTCPP